MKTTIIPNVWPCLSGKKNMFQTTNQICFNDFPMTSDISIHDFHDLFPAEHFDALSR